MDNDAILTSLRTEKAEKERLIETATARVLQLAGAIALLEGKPVPAPAAITPEGPSIADVVEKAVLTFGPNAVFDAQEVKGVATRATPDMQGRIKRGIYNALKTLERKKVIRRCPGGFCMAEKEVAGLDRR